MSSFNERLNFVKNNQNKIANLANQICKGNAGKDNKGFCATASIPLENLSIHQLDMIYFLLKEKKL